MELIVAILIALGALTSPDLYTDAYRAENYESVERAQYIINNSLYQESADGGVIIDEGENP